MTTKLKALLLLQEVDLLLDDLEEAASGRQEEAARGFTLGSTRKLQSKRDRLVQEVGPELIDRYEQLRRRNRRAVAPVRRGVCLGCYTVRPTKSSTTAGRVDTCERCGRILFPAEERVEAPASQAQRGRSRSKVGRQKRPTT